MSGNDLVFVPAGASQISLGDGKGGPAPASAYSALSTFIDSQDCLKNARGHFVERGACRNPWTEFLNLRGTWRSPELIKGQGLEVQLDIFNFLNLLNNKWGLTNTAANFENANSTFLKAVGYDMANQRPIYQFAAPATVTSTGVHPDLVALAHPARRPLPLLISRRATGGVPGSSYCGASRHVTSRSVALVRVAGTGLSRTAGSVVAA